MDGARHFLAEFCMVALPPGVLFWFLIHPWVRWWRRWGPVPTYLTVLPILLAIAASCFTNREVLVGADLGTNGALIAISTMFFAPMMWLESQYWRHLSIATLIGIPELSRPEQRKGKLLREGIYGVVRHPRYLSAGLGLIGMILISNYVGLYVFCILLVPVGYAMVLLEERELVERFGGAYRQYQREVPPIIPRFRKR